MIRKSVVDDVLLHVGTNPNAYVATSVFRRGLFLVRGSVYDLVHTAAYSIASATLRNPEVRHAR